MTAKTTAPSIVDLARELGDLIQGREFTPLEIEVLNKLKTDIFVNVTKKNLEDFGIQRPGA